MIRTNLKLHRPYNSRIELLFENGEQHPIKHNKGNCALIYKHDEKKNM